MNIDNSKQSDSQSVNPIDGIKCDVSNCIYHAKDNSCFAGKIEVGPQHAENYTQTVCATFEYQDATNTNF